MRNRADWRARSLGVAVLCRSIVRTDAVATYPSEFRFSWCFGADCSDYGISAAHFQLKLASYYAEGSRPPLREAFFVATLPLEYLRELVLGCPGLAIMAHVLLAEVRLYTHPPEEAAELMARVDAMTAMPEIVGPHLDHVHGSWPYLQARAQYESTLLHMQAVASSSVDIVLPRCREDLSWLGDRTRLEVLPAQTRIFIYEKCGGQSLANLSRILEPDVEIFDVLLEDAADPMTGLAARRDECTAYLNHVVRQYAVDASGGTGFSDVTLFLHGDPGDHTPMGLLNLVLRGLASGGLSYIQFLHMGSPRMVYTTNPCQVDIFELAIGRPLRQPMTTVTTTRIATRL